MKIDLTFHRGSAVNTEPKISAGRPEDCGLIPGGGGGVYRLSKHLERLWGQFSLLFVENRGIPVFRTVKRK